MNDFHYNFYQARVHRANCEIVRAEQFCAKALELDPNHTGALSLYGNIKSAQGHHEEARDAYAKAVAIEPNNTMALINLAAAVRGVGDFDQAREILEKAIAIDKTFAPAYYTLAGITRFKADDPIIEDFKSLKKRVYGNPLYRCVASFALGKIYNDIGEWDLAFENYTEGNSLRGSHYNHKDTQNLFNAIKQTFNKQLLADHQSSGNNKPDPIFIIGMPRSGSSLIEDILSRSSDIAGLGEPPDIDNLFASSYKIASADNQIVLRPAINGTHFRGLGETYLDAMRKIAPDAKRIIDKNLLNHGHTGFIRLIFPKSSIIHVTRDPIDTCLSCYFQNFTEGHDYSFDLRNIGKRYAAYADIMKHWNDVMGDNIYTVAYEDLIHDQDAQIKKLFALIGLPAPAADEIAKPAERMIYTASSWQARQPIYKTSVKRWRNYEKHLGPLFEAFDEVGFDYEGVG